jgi:hypothetical protein
MKIKNLIFASAVSMIVPCMFGCYSQKKSQQPLPAKPSFQTVGKTKQLIPWKEEYLPMFGDGQIGIRRVKDSIDFYPSVNIEIDTSIEKSPTISIRNGGFTIFRITDEIAKAVTQDTPGALQEIIEGIYVIKFSKNDITYTFHFFPDGNQNFILSADATLKFEGNDYHVTVRTGNSNCLLNVDGHEQAINHSYRDKAEGIKH